MLHYCTRADRLLSSGPHPVLTYEVDDESVHVSSLSCTVVTAACGFKHSLCTRAGCLCNGHQNKQSEGCSSKICATKDLCARHGAVHKRSYRLQLTGSHVQGCRPAGWAPTTAVGQADWMLTSLTITRAIPG
jgi:hypothetical protein